MPVPDLDLTGWTIAFDLDGTLIDTAPDLAASLNAVLAEQGVAPVSIEDARTMVGHGAKAMIERGYAATGIPLPPEVAPQCFERFIEIYRARIAQESRPFPGCLEALEALEDAGAVLVEAPGVDRVGDNGIAADDGEGGGGGADGVVIGGRDETMRGHDHCSSVAESMTKR